MERYRNLGGDSSIDSFETGEGEITVKFKDGWKYLYNTQSTTTANIIEMQRLAKTGQGLNRFIVQNVRKHFAKKWK